MLKNITIENSSGISEKIELDFRKGNYRFKEQYIYDEIISPAVLYGHNSSGKTSVLRTFNNIFNIFNGDLTRDNTYAMKNLFYDEECTKINMELKLKGNFYHYFIEMKNKNIIVNEEVIINDNKHFSRSLVKDIPTNMSFIRYLVMNGLEPDLNDIYEYMKNITFISTEKKINSIRTSLELNKLLVKHNEKYKNISRHFEEIMDLTFYLEATLDGERIRAIYEKNNESYKFDYKTMLSSGTRDFYEMLALIFELPENTLLIIDEIEKTFHPDLVRKIVKYLSENFPIQIITSSHNTNFMKALRPDQLYITKKENDIVSVNRVSEKYPGIREIHNLEKLYMGGKFE